MHPVLETASIHKTNKELIKEITRLDSKCALITSKTTSDKLLQKRLAQVKFINVTLGIMRDTLDHEAREMEHLYIGSLSS
jgi:hypothetical protein